MTTTSDEHDEPMPSPSPGGPHAVDRDAHPRRCIGHVRSGRQCRAYAVEGMSVCRMHGGSSPQAREAARRRKAEAQATAMLELVWDPAAPPVTNPIEALQRLAGRLEHAANVLGSRLSTETLDGPTAVAWTRVLQMQRQALEGMERLDLDAKQIKLDQQLAEVVVVAFRAALGAVTLLPADRDLMLSTYLARLGSTLPDDDVVVGEVER